MFLLSLRSFGCIGLRIARGFVAYATPSRPSTKARLRPVDPRSRFSIVLLVFSYLMTDGFTVKRVFESRCTAFAETLMYPSASFIAALFLNCR